MALAGRLASHVAGVTAAGAALHFNTRGPDDKVGRGGVHLAPGNLIDGGPHLTHRRDSFFNHWGAREGEEGGGTEGGGEKRGEEEIKILLRPRSLWINLFTHFWFLPVS